MALNNLSDKTPGTPLAVMLLLGSAALWSTGGVLIKWIDWNPMAITGVRSAIASVVLLTFIGKPKITWSFAQLGGALSFTVTVFLFVSAIKLTTAANAVLLHYTTPIYTALFSSWFLKERTSPYDWLATAVVVGGVALFFFDKLEARGLWGNIMAISSGFTWAWLALFLRKQKSGSPFESILLGHWLTFIIGIPFMFRGGPSVQGWVGLALLGIFQLGISYVMYAYAIRKVKAIEAILIFAIEPVLNPILVFIIIGEMPGKMALFGAVIVLGAVTVRSIFHIKRGNVDSEDKP
ncbi:MAG: EamA family transporter [Spirochaetota bacterium]|nr:MAG: EamA family transporter [Spirochaetota bacterium]